jgi:hypothetical protein
MPKGQGGARPGAGAKKKAIGDKIESGSHNTNVLNLPIIETFEIPMQEMPKLRDYMRQEQKGGNPLHSEEIYKETWEWLARRRCDSVISPMLVENYAQSFARWIQAEELVSTYGFITKGNGGNPKLSPFINMAHAYHRQLMSDWMLIWQTVRENFSAKYDSNPHDDLMERLLASKSV